MPHTHPEVTEYVEKSGQLHRLDGPAVVGLQGDYFAWYMHGKLHRTDGPAIFYRVGDQDLFSYFVNGRELTKEEFDKHFGDD